MMADKTELKARLAFWQKSLERLREAYLALVDGGVKSYVIGDRELTKLDLDTIADEIEAAEKKVDELTAAIDGKGRRKTVGVILRDW